MFYAWQNNDNSQVSIELSLTYLEFCCSYFLLYFGYPRFHPSNPNVPFQTLRFSIQISIHFYPLVSLCSVYPIKLRENLEHLVFIISLRSFLYLQRLSIISFHGFKTLCFVSKSDILRQYSGLFNQKTTCLSSNYPKVIDSMFSLH